MSPPGIEYVDFCSWVGRDSDELPGRQSTIINLQIENLFTAKVFIAWNRNLFNSTSETCKPRKSVQKWEPVGDGHHGRSTVAPSYSGSPRSDPILRHFRKPKPVICLRFPPEAIIRVSWPSSDHATIVAADECREDASVTTSRNVCSRCSRAMVSHSPRCRCIAVGVNWTPLVETLRSIVWLHLTSCNALEGTSGQNVALWIFHIGLQYKYM